MTWTVIEHLLRDSYAHIAAIGGIFIAIVGISRKWIIPTYESIRHLVDQVDYVHNAVQTNGDGRTVADLALSNSHQIQMVRNDIGELRWIQSESLSGILFVCDLEGRNRMVSKEYSDWLGVRREDLMGFGWRNHIVTDDLDDYDYNWQGVFGDQRKGDVPVVYRHAQTGERMPCLVNLTPHIGTDPSDGRYMGRVYPTNEARAVIVDPNPERGAE